MPEGTVAIMGSNERSSLPLSSRPETKAVYVSLDALFPPPEPSSGVEGLELRGWAAGALQRWERSTTGQWVGIVTFVVRRSDGTTFKAVEQLVPAEALRPQ